MKKLVECTKRFISAHYKLSFCVTVAVFLVSCIAGVYSRLTVLAMICFGFSLASMLRLITYKTGKLPFFYGR